MKRWNRVWLSVLCCQLLLTGCGGAPSPDDAGGASSVDGSGTGGSSSVTPGSGGTSSGGASGSGAASTGSGASSSQGGTDPTQPLDPSVFDPIGPPPEPRTDGDRVAPGPRVDCPETEPTVGDACDKDELTCTYGETANWRCRRKYTCESEWVRRNADCMAPPDDCADGPSPGLACTYPDPGGFHTACEIDSMICYCPAECNWLGCSPAEQPQWICITPPVDLDCPLLPPNLGEGCAQQAQRCVYGNPSCEVGNGVIVFCRQGVWEEEGVPCLE